MLKINDKKKLFKRHITKTPPLYNGRVFFLSTGSTSHHSTAQLLSPQLVYKRRERLFLSALLPLSTTIKPTPTPSLSSSTVLPFFSLATFPFPPPPPPPHHHHAPPLARSTSDRHGARGSWRQSLPGGMTRRRPWPWLLLLLLRPTTALGRRWWWPWSSS